MADRVPVALLFQWRDRAMKRPGPAHWVRVRAENLLAAVEELAASRGVNIYDAAADPRPKKKKETT